MSPGLMNALVLPDVIAILPGEDITADGNGDGVDVSKFEAWGTLVCQAANIAGTTPTLDLKLQHSEDDGVADAYADVTDGALVQITDTLGLIQQLKVNLSSAKKYIRIVKDIGGTATPRFFAGVALVAFRKDRSQA